MVNKRGKMHPIFLFRNLNVYMTIKGSEESAGYLDSPGKYGEESEGGTWT